MTSLSIILRVKNEAPTLGAVLDGIARQRDVAAPEVVVVDSGSTDDTVAIAEAHGAKIVRIAPEDFTWGGAINTGIATAAGEIAVMLSGHCIPVGEHWLRDLVAPFADSTVAATSSRHVADLDVDPLEAVELADWFPPGEESVRDVIYSNGAGAVRRSVWQTIQFDEGLMLCEDGEWAMRVRAAGHHTVYRPTSQVIHSHHPTVDIVYRRWFWRALTGVQIVEGARDGQIPYLLYKTARYLLRDIAALCRAGRLWALWRAPFYEMARQWGAFRGARMAGKIGMRGERYECPIPRLVLWCDPILRGLERRR